MDTRHDSYDAIVVGARCAGAATAMLLARAGLRVLAVDRARYGSDTLSTHALMRGGVLQLRRWGLLEALRATGVPPVRTTSFRYADEEVRIPIQDRDGVDALYAPRRTVLDALLVDAARAAGAEVVHGVRLVDLARNGAARVTGAVVQHGAGAPRRIAARIVIGADGTGSAVAGLVGAAPTRAGRHAAAVVYGYWSGLALDGYEWCYVPGVSTGAIPTHDGQTCVFVSVPQRRLHDEIRRDVETGYRRALAEASPELAHALAGATRAGRFRATPGEPGYLRRAHGPGWALVGDAGYFRDPITAHGMTDAFRDAELLARAVVRGTDDALADYETVRNVLSEAFFDATDAIASFDWDLAEVQRLHQALSEAMKVEIRALRALDGYGSALGRTA